MDLRVPNRLCRRPPRSWLGTATALTHLDLSDKATAEACGGRLPADLRVMGAPLDLYNGFNQFKNPQLGSFFGVDYPETAGVGQLRDLQRADAQDGAHRGRRALLCRLRGHADGLVLGPVLLQPDHGHSLREGRRATGAGPCAGGRQGPFGALTWTTCT